MCYCIVYQLPVVIFQMIHLPSKICVFLITHFNSEQKQARYQQCLHASIVHNSSMRQLPNYTIYPKSYTIN